MQRLFCPSENISKENIIISDKDQLHHIKDVLRFKEKEKVEVFDEKGNIYLGVIEKLLPESIIINIKTKEKSDSQHKDIMLTVACAIPKKSKMEDIVDKLTQLGVERIIPMQTERVIVKLDSHKEKLRLERWKKVALNAVEQCQGCALPVIEPVKNIEEVLSQSQGYDLKLIPALFGERITLKNILDKTKPKKILILIGPEGDFTKEEVNLAVRAGFIPITLGERVLRVETAAVAVTSYIRLTLSAPEHQPPVKDAEC